MSKKKTKFHNAHAYLTRDSICIQVKLKDLPAILQGASTSGVVNPPAKITDTKKFAQEVIHSLNNEDDQGTTMVHKMFDRAFNDAINQGAEGDEDWCDE